MPDIETIRLANNCKLTRGTMKVGPRHDPYHREYVRKTRTRPDGVTVVDWVLVNCSLAGLYIEVGDDGSHCTSRFDMDSTDGHLEEEILRITGCFSRDLLDRVWVRREEHRMRQMTPAQRGSYWLMREADARLRGYAY